MSSRPVESTHTSQGGSLRSKFALGQAKTQEQPGATSQVITTQILSPNLVGHTVKVSPWRLPLLFNSKGNENADLSCSTGPVV